ncbi:carboxyltransferase domain-containing protein [Candidatus Pelagibacter sp.]|nr:carboxyltransferase domain-containing protein [Candidatus Pelagibacter sp.]MDB4246342.1 carboxyltransferase domain-containing protein [Candidatus Pelagibacter sp.]
MKKILIANRGEIACRIIDSCKKLNLHSIAVYSDVDKNSKHVRKADESIHIGGSKAQESYLSAVKIIEAAKNLKADAIHPGYGFMAENADFAQKVIDSGIIWIGPKPSTIISMGNKDIARNLAIKNNLPICPGLNNEDLKKNDLEKKCNEIGFPILIKASAGGGGIGMHIANNFEQLIQSIEKTKNLAQKAFGNSDIFLEKFISNARHIEIQVFGLGEKKALHFYERDCSIQRRFQKIIEESPAPKIEQSIIDEMAESAVNFVTNQKYEGAGTIEYIYDIDNKKFYFLEMNTRIQVEHPVTEAVTNFDLVAMQIKFALNMSIDTIEQSKINKSGYAIECRLYAEDPTKNFLPSPGKISKLKIPNTGLHNIRLDIGVDEGDEISFYYDPMIAKIISKGATRTECINNMIRYLNELELEGINTNKSFLISVLQNESFENAIYNTKFIENNLSLFTEKKVNTRKIEKHISTKENVVQKYTDKDVEAFKKIISESPKDSSSQLYTKKDFTIFNNILNKENNIDKKKLTKNIIGKVYDEPVFKPGGDKYMFIEFGNLMDLEINFTAQNLAKAIYDNKIKGIYETAPCFASMLIHYNPDEIKFNDLKNEMKSVIKSLGPTDDIEINSRIFSFPTVYLDKWTKECIEDYSSKIAQKTPDPEFIVELNNLENTEQFVRVHSGTEYWVSALGFWPGLPFMMPLDPRCKLTAPKYNPPRTWTPKGAVGMGGSSTSIYPDRLPGGYQIFGIIPVPIWDTQKSFSVFEESICLFKPGDRVKFVPTSYEEFDHVSNKVKDKSYDYNIIEYQKFSVKNYKQWLTTIDKTKRF